jgi:hypothetical protein
MGSDRRFWLLFGGIWLAVGLGFVAISIGLRWTSNLIDALPWLLWVFLVVGLACAGAGAGVIYWANVRAARAKRLLDSGIPLFATVIGIRRSAMEINEEPRFHVTYRYEYSSGRSFEGESGMMRAEEAEAFRTGDRVAIKADPQNPADSILIGPA